MDHDGVRDNSDEQRYELPAGGEVAVLEYERQGDVVTLTHTFVPESLRGHGLATRLVADALADLRARGLKVLPECPTVVAYMKAHPDTHDLLAPDARVSIGG